MAQRARDILKTISSFDTDKDFDNRESRERLANLFRDLILNPEQDAKDFFVIFSEQISDILKDLDIKEKEQDDVDDPSGDSPVGVQDDEVEIDDEEESEDEEIPDELMGDSYNYTQPIIEQASRYIY